MRNYRLCKLTLGNCRALIGKGKQRAAIREHRSGSGTQCDDLDFRIQVKESFQAGAQLLLDLFFAAFEDVHGDMGVASILQLEGRVADFRDFVGREQPHAVYKSQVCHALDFKRNSASVISF